MFKVFLLFVLLALVAATIYAYVKRKELSAKWEIFKLEAFIQQLTAEVNGQEQGDPLVVHSGRRNLPALKAAHEEAHRLYCQGKFEEAREHARAAVDSYLDNL